MKYLIKPDISCFLDKGLIVFFLFFLSTLPVWGQKKIWQNTYQITATGGLSSNKNLPFWFRANQYGQAPASGNFIQLRGSMHHDYDSLLTRNKKLQPWGLGYGLGLTGNLTVNKPVLLLPEAYLKIRHKNWELYAGRRKEIFGLTDSAMTSGSYIWSGNALPMPKVQLHTPGFVPLGKKGSIAYKAGISHGWFGSDSVIQNYWLHQKWLYGKIGKGKMQLMSGINHHVMWGGYSEILKNVGGQYPPTINGYLAPNVLYSFQYILIPFLQKIRPPSNNKVPGYDGGLAVGNHLGSIDLLCLLTLKKAQVLVYKQLPYDYGRSISQLSNIEDGLHGVKVSFQNINLVSEIILEWFNSKSQGLYTFRKLNPRSYGEFDNYFLHGQYRSWNYRNQIIGTPFILSNDQNLIFNNRVQYLYSAFKGRIGDIKYFWANSYSKNYGTYRGPMLKYQYSGLLKLSLSSKNYYFPEFSLSWDYGELYHNSLAIQTSHIFKF